MEDYVKRYTEIFKTPRGAGDETLTDRNYSNTPEPVRFLEKISPKTKSLLTATEEIYNQEKNNFYNKARLYHTPLPVKKLSIFQAPAKSLSRNRVLRTSNKSVGQINNRSPLQFVSQRERTTTSRIEPERQRNRRRFSKIDYILRTCEDVVDKATESSKKLKGFIDKERRIAIKYSKELEWTSSKLSELNGYNNDMMKVVYQEYKAGNCLYEKEKEIIAKKFNAKISKSCRTKAKDIKRLLLKFKHKVMP